VAEAVASIPGTITGKEDVVVERMAHRVADIILVKAADPGEQLFVDGTSGSGRDAQHLQDALGHLRQASRQQVAQLGRQRALGSSTQRCSQ
jgi:hypothetical protein